MKVIFFNIFFTLALLELSSYFVFNTFLEKKIASLKNFEWGTKHLPLQKQDRISGGYLGKVPHPYFGFSHFESSFERPDLYNKIEDTKYRVGIFGGSVAEQLSEANNKYKILDQFSKNQFLFKFNGLDFLSFALGGYRQPQSYFISTVYGHNLQLAINIEGVNELGPTVDDLPPYFPMGFISNLYFRSLEEMSKVPDLHQRAIKESFLRKKLENDNFLFSTSKLYYLAQRIYNLAHMGPIADSLNTSPKYRFYRSSKWDYTIEKKFNAWMKFSCLQQNAMKALGVPNYFIVQPVPQNFKTLTIREESIVSNSRPGELEIARFFAKADLSKLKTSGLNLIDLRNVFSSHTQELYVDSCCHFNEEGNYLFLKQIYLELDRLLKHPAKDCNLQLLTQLLKK